MFCLCFLFIYLFIFNDFCQTNSTSPGPVFVKFSEYNDQSEIRFSIHQENCHGSQFLDLN